MIPIAIVLITAWGASYLQFVEVKKEKPLSVSLIQGNIPQDLKWLTEYQIKTLEIYVGLTRTEWGRDLIVWPESSIPLFQTDIPEFLSAMNEEAIQSNSAWVTGIPFWDVKASQTENKLKYYNSIMASGSESADSYCGSGMGCI